MTQDEYDDIIDRKHKWEDESCRCHINPPCSKCENMPSEEEINEAIAYAFQTDWKPNDNEPVNTDNLCHFPIHPRLGVWCAEIKPCTQHGDWTTPETTTTAYPA